MFSQNKTKNSNLSVVLSSVLQDPYPEWIQYSHLVGEYGLKFQFSYSHIPFKHLVCTWYYARESGGQEAVSAIASKSSYS